MEDKRYPEIDEEQGIGMCCEPIGEVASSVGASVNGITGVHDWVDDLDWDRFPILGPKTEEEALARIDKFEKEMTRGDVKWISSEEAWEQLYSKYPWLR